MNCYNKIRGYNPAEIFEEQLEKCGVEYFDFYLLHNVNENSIKAYKDPQWGMLEYFKEQKRLGRIKHLGFAECEGEIRTLNRTQYSGLGYGTGSWR